MGSLRLKLTSVVAGLVLGLLLLEAGVRIFLPQFSPDHEVAFSFDPTRDIYAGPANKIARQRKNTGDYDVEVRFNRHGLRDSEDVALAQKGDWVVVGDSFSFGWGVKQTERFSDLVADDLDRAVYNVAIPGDLDHYEKLLAYAEREGADTSRVILGLCVENDVIDYELKRSSLNEVVATPAIVALKRKMGRYVATYRALTEVAHSMPRARKVAVSAGVVQPGNVASHAPLSAQSIRSTVARVLAIAENRELVVLLIPSRQVFNPSEKTKARAQHRALVELLHDAHLQVVDPLAEFDRGENPLQDFYFEHDGHWNSRGHAIAARELVQEIIQSPGAQASKH